MGRRVVHVAGVLITSLSYLDRQMRALINELVWFG